MQELLVTTIKRAIQESKKKKLLKKVKFIVLLVSCRKVLFENRTLGGCANSVSITSDNISLLLEIVRGPIFKEVRSFSKIILFT